MVKSDTIFTVTPRNISIYLGSVLMMLLLLLDRADPFAVVMAYFVESVLIGLVNFTKILLTLQSPGKPNGKGVWFKAFFFLIHYSFFIFVQSVFVFAMFSMSDDNIKDPFNVFANFAYAFSMRGFGWSMAILALAILIEVYLFYIRPQKYKVLTADELFFKPYVRVLVQQFTVLLAMFFVMITGLGLIVALMLIVIRLLVDLTGIYISSSDENLKRVALYINKGRKQSDEEAANSLKKFF